MRTMLIAVGLALACCGAALGASQATRNACGKAESTHSPRQSLLVDFQYPCGRPRDGFGNEQRPVRSLALAQVGMPQKDYRCDGTGGRRPAPKARFADPRRAPQNS